MMNRILKVLLIAMGVVTAFWILIGLYADDTGLVFLIWYFVTATFGVSGVIVHQCFRWDHLK